MNRFLLGALVVTLWMGSGQASAARLEVQFRTELAQPAVVVPPFGTYTSDVTIRAGSIAKGTFQVDVGPGGTPGLFVGEVQIHLENYLFHNNDDMTALYYQIEGWSTEPTIWTVSDAESSAMVGPQGMFDFYLKAYRGVNRFSLNRPFHANADVAGTYDLEDIAVGSSSTTWNTTYFSDRTSVTIFSVTPVPEPSAISLMAVGLLTLISVQFRSGPNRSTQRSRAPIA